jgi:type VI secretion system protein ImpF
MNGRIPRRRSQGEAPRVQLPLLDRLIDDAPDAQRDSPRSLGDAETALRNSVRRDLEALLNARRRWRSVSPDYAQLPSSLIGYGISDFASGAFNSAEQRDRLRSEIEEAIRQFEPRLTGVRVSLVERNNNLDSTLRLQIEGMLRTEPAPEPIAFETLVDSATTEVTVRPDSEKPIATPGDV